MTNRPSNTTVPSLFAITAPAGRDKASAASADRFAGELSAASKPETSRAEKPKSDPAKRPEHDSTSKNEASTRPDNPKAEKDQRTDSANEAAPSEESKEDNASETAENGLLSVTTATETLVAETSPETVLPDEATTAIDVGTDITLADQTLADQPIEPSNEGAAADPELASTIVGTSGDAIAQAATNRANQAIENVDSPDSSHQQAAVALESVPATASVSNPPQSDTPNTADGETTLANSLEGGSDATDLSTDGSLSIDTTKTDSEASESEAEMPSTEKLPLPVESKPDVASTATRSEPATPSPVVAGANSPTPAGPAQSDMQATPPSEPSVSVDASRFVNRVTSAIDRAGEQGRPIEIRLSPPELGALRISLELKEGVMTASLEAETPAARTTLLDNLPALRDRLEQQQIRIDKFDVNVRDDSGERGGDWQSADERQQRNDQRSGDRPARHTPPVERAEPRTPSPASSETLQPRTITFDNSGINLVV